MKLLCSLTGDYGFIMEILSDGDGIFHRYKGELSPQAVRTYDGEIIPLKKSVLRHVKDTSYVKTLIRGKYFKELADAVIKELFPND